MDTAKSLLSASLSEGESDTINVEMKGSGNQLLDLHAYVAGSLFYELVGSGVEKGEAVSTLIGCVQKGLSETVQSDIAKANGH